MFIRTTSEDKGFEDILTKYLKRSEEKQIDLRRSLKRKHKIIKKALVALFIVFILNFSGVPAYAENNSLIVKV